MIDNERECEGAIETDDRIHHCNEGDDLSLQSLRGEVRDSPASTLGKVPRNFEPCFYHAMSLDGILQLYSQTFDRSTEAACTRTPIDLILMECLGELVSVSALFIAVLTYLRLP